MTIQAVLFDADGVLQRPAADFLDVLREAMGDANGDLDGFLSDVFDAEVYAPPADVRGDDAMRTLLRPYLPG